MTLSPQVHLRLRYEAVEPAFKAETVTRIRKFYLIELDRKGFGDHSFQER
jgi:hypothetical protein